MAIIGTFQKQDNRFEGQIKTLTINTPATFEPVTQKSGDKSPDYRILAHGHEIGAAWSKTSQAGKAYLSVKIDDPSFAAAVTCSLFEATTGDHELIWQR
jgi:uncharacterized protein (DUF736 family)